MSGADKRPREDRAEGETVPRDVSETLAWCAAFSIASAALLLTRFASQDPDSTLYAGISARLAALPLRNWIAPEWWNLWARFEGPYREHPVGVFLLPALLGRLGVPPLQAAFVVGAAFSIAALFLLRRVGALVVGQRESAVVPWVALILPTAFVYRIRATQEYPVLVLLLLAIYATEKSRTSAAWIVVTVLAACATALVKGIFVVFVPIVCGLWLICIREEDRHDRLAWLGLGLSMAAVALCAISYEALYRRLTGNSFLDFYLSYRLNQGDPRRASEKLYNFVWYSGRLLWFAFPGTLALIVFAVKRTRTGPGGRTGREAQGLRFALGVAAAYLLVMSAGGTKADRYLFPAYFALGIAGAFLAIRRWDRAARWANRLATLEPRALALGWLLLFLAALPFELKVPYVKFWP